MAKGRTFLLLLTLLLCAPFSQALAEKRIALVIGNSEYTRISALPNPSRDAALMVDTLTGLGFEVVEARDVTRREMGSAIQEFGRKLREAGTEAVGLFYYAGHGVQAAGANYLIPLDAQIDTEADLEFSAVSAQWVLAQMEFAGNALNIVVLDACRNNPFKGSFRSLGRGLARMNAPRGSVVAYAAAPGQTASDGVGGNSPYTQALSQAMREPGLDLEDVFKRVRVEVEDATGGAQTPWEESSLRGDFFFKQAAPEPEPQAAPEPAPAPAALNSYDREALFWESIKDGDSIAMFQAYLTQFPEGTFAPLAEVKIAQLEASQAAALQQAQARAAEQQVAALPPEEPADPDEIHLKEERALGLTRFQRREVQQALTVLGYDTRGADGVLGNNSRRAIAAYQRDKGAEATGYLTAALHENLMSDAEAPLAELAEREAAERAAAEAAQPEPAAPAPAVTQQAALPSGGQAAEIASLEAQIASLEQAKAEAAGGAAGFDGLWTGNFTMVRGNATGYGILKGGSMRLIVKDGRATREDRGRPGLEGSVSPDGAVEGTFYGNNARQYRFEGRIEGGQLNGSFSGGVRRYEATLTRESSGGDTAAIAAYDAQIKALQVRLQQLQTQ